MSPRPRIASVSVASVVAVGLSVAIGVAPQATADPCEGAAAAAQPGPGQNVRLPSPGARAFVPLGHRPVGANERAPLPKLGQLPLAILHAITPRSAQVQQQAAVIPPPNPHPNQPAPNPAQPAPEAAPAPPAPPPEPSGPATTSLVGWVTGPNSPNNTIRRFAISGTDLGIMWDNGDPANNQVLMAFGDTSGYCSVPDHQWRYNTLMRSADRSLSNTIDVASSPALRPGISKQIIKTIRAAPDEDGIIPTAGISVGRTQYLNFMSIKSWDANGAWSTNFSAIAMSPDNGENWGVYPRTIRTPEGGNENFQQGAFVRPGDGYVYSFGTPAGRGGSVYLTRVPQGFVPDLTKYEYWNSSGSWVPRNPAAATPVFPGPVGEMSAQYNTYLKQYLALYCNGMNDVVLRTAPAPQGPWGPEQLLVSSFSIPGGIYAPFLHPWSTGKELYFNLSLWSAYNVMLMHTVLP